MERLLDSTEVADLLNVPLRTLDAWAHRGIGPVYVRIGRHRRYRPDDVQSFVTARAVPTEAA